MVDEIENSEMLFAKYLSDSKILIADSSQASRARLTKTLLELGAKIHLIKGYASFDQALQGMEEFNPKIVITDYKIGRQSGFDLLTTFRQKHPEGFKNTLFILITANSSQSLVARAAEEDIDTFILKPYTVKSLKDTLVKSATAKLYPSPYVQTIDKGKEFLLQGDPATAMTYFSKAKGMHPQPTLACFYYGQAEIMQAALDDAEKAFKEGLGYNKIHYKCLISLFDLLYKDKRFLDAYDVVKTLAQFFPANPARLATVLRLAIVTENYQDVEKYYQFFIDLETRSEEVVTYVCASLAVCGKYYLQNKYNSRAIALFDKLSVSATGKAKFLRFAVEYLYEYKLYSEAKDFLNKFKNEDRGGDDYDIASFVATANTLSSLDALQKSLERIKSKKQNSYVLYLIAILKLSELSRFDEAQLYMKEAIKRYPEKYNTFIRIKNLYIDAFAKLEETGEKSSFRREEEWSSSP